MPESPRQRVMGTIRAWIGGGSCLPGTRLPTEGELAAELGVSRGTVRNALGELVKEGLLEWRPNIGCFVSGDVPPPVREQRSVTFLLPEEHRKSGGLFLAGIEEAAAARGVRLQVVILKPEPERFDPVIAELASPLSAGAILLPRQCADFYEWNSRLIDRLTFAGIRHVVIDTPVSAGGIIRGNFVGSDGYSASREIIDLLAAAGHRQIASIRVFAGIHSAESRFRGVTDQLGCRGIPCRPEYHLPVEEGALLRGQGRRRIHELMALPEPPTAVVCSHDELAFNVIDELKTMGVRVPGEVSVVGFDDMEVATLIDLTTVAQPFHDIGKRAAEILLEDDAARKRPTRQEFLPCHLIQRGTVAELAIHTEI